MYGNTPAGSPATPSENYTTTYDDAGNMTSDGKEYNYRYDVFGRLLGIDTETTDDPVKSYRYNGLGWRIVDDNGSDTEHERWQLVATYKGSGQLWPRLTPARLRPPDHGLRAVRGR